MLPSYLPFRFFERKDDLFLMVHAFFDESSHLTRQSDFICMTGYIAFDNAWDNFQRDWSHLLEKHSLHAMHTADFLAGEAEYRDLKWSEDKKQAVLSEFIKVIRERTLAGFAVGLDSRAYREITAGVEKRKKPHVFCFERILRLVKDRLTAWGYPGNVAMVFDDIEAYAMQCYHAYCVIKQAYPDLKRLFTGIAFADDVYTLPLQAADLLACASNKEKTFGDMAWADGHSRFRELLFDANPSYGKRYDTEDWRREELIKRRDEIIQVASWPSSRVIWEAQSS